MKKYEIIKKEFQIIAYNAIMQDNPSLLVGNSLVARNTNHHWRKKKVTLEPFMSLVFVIPKDDIYIGRDIYTWKRGRDNHDSNILVVPLISLVAESIMRDKKDKLVEEDVPRCFRIHKELNDAYIDLFDYAKICWLEYRGKVYNLI